MDYDLPHKAAENDPKEERGMKKKALSLLLSVLLCALLVPVMATAASTGTHTHCICGDPTCTEWQILTSDNPHVQVDFTAWTDALAREHNGGNATASNSLPSKRGSYYLTKNVTIDGKWRPQDDTTLCLNGYDIVSTSTHDGDAVIEVGSSNVYELKDQNRHFYLTCCGASTNRGVGEISHRGNAKGIGILVSYGAYGTLYSEGTRDNYFYMYNGHITNNTYDIYGTPNNYRGGGGIRNRSTTYMYGGIIDNNGAAGNVASGMADNNLGGGIINEGTFEMYGGTIKNNKARMGGGIYNKGTFTMYNGTVSGNAVCNVNHNGSGTYAGAGGGIYNTGTFTLVSGTVSDNKITPYGASKTERTTRGGGIYNSGTLTIGAEGGLASSVMISGNLSQTDVDSEWNRGSYGGGIYNAGKLTVNCGTFANNKAVNTAENGRAYGGAIHSEAIEGKDCTLTLGSNVKFTGNSASSGGALYNSGSNLTISGDVTFDGNRAGKTGGALTCDGGKTVTINGNVSFTNNSAESGGAIYNCNAKLNINGNVAITDNTATNNGGGVFSRSVFNFHSGEIKNNQALSSTGGAGGGVYSTGTFTMNDTKIDNNTAGVGGGVYNGGGTFMFNGGTIKNNKAVRGSDTNNGLGAGGGGVYNAATFTMNGGTINNNTAAKSNTVSGGSFCHGGGVYNANTVNLYGGFILNNATGGDAAGDGGGIYHNGYALNVNGTVSISSNTAHNGGGIYLNSGSTTFIGGVVQHNTAHYGYGGGVYYYSGTSLNISGQTQITGNKRVQYTGGNDVDVVENLLLNEGCTVTVGSLFGTAKIGVSANETPTAGNHNSAVVLSKNAAGSNCLKYMTADAAIYQLSTNSDNKLVLMNKCEHTSVTSGGKCNDCGAQMAAKVEKLNGSILQTFGYYATVTEAVENVPANGAVVLCAPLTKDVILERSISYSFRTNGDNAKNVTITVASGNVKMDGSFGTVSVGAAATVKFFGYDTSIKCLTTTKSDLSSTLSDGWCFKVTDENGTVTWHDNTCKDKTLYDVELAAQPLRSVNITPETVSALTYGYDNAPVLTANAKRVSGFGANDVVETENATGVAYEWYIGSTPMGTNSTSFTFPADKAAGTYTVTCVATKDGYSKKSNEVTVTVNPAEVTVSNFTIAEKTYDGNTNATVNDLEVKHGETSLVKDTDYTVTAAFENANAGTNKPVTVTVTLLNKNYKFSDGTSVYTDSSKRANINQRTAVTPADITRYVKANGGETYTYVINALLHTINDGGSYGALSSSTVAFEAEEAANQYTITYSVENDTSVKFTPTLKADGTAAAENTKLGTLTVTTKATNYSGTGENGKITLKIDIVATNKTIPNLGGDINNPIILQTREIPYGTKLSEIPLQQRDGINLSAFSWDDGRNGATVLPVGTHWVGWKFTPADENYAEIQGSVPITVYKVTPDVTVTDLSKTYDGQPFAAADAAAGTVTNPHDSSLIVAGTWSWKDGSAPVNAADSTSNGKTWKVVFTPNDLNNYYVVEKDVSVTISKRPVTLTGVTAADRTYEVGNDTVLLSGGELSRAETTGGNDDSANPPTEGSGDDGASPLLLRAAAPADTGIIYGDDVWFELGVGRLADGNAGVNKPVTPAVQLVGADADNYELSPITNLTATITPRSISDATVVIVDASFTGSAVKPTVKVYLHGLELTENVDYTLSGHSATLVGEYTLTVTGKGNYKDEAGSGYTWHIVEGTVSESKSVYVNATVAEAARGLTQRLTSADGSWGAGVQTREVDRDRLPSNVTAYIRNGVLYYTISNGHVGDVVTIPVLFTSRYYESVIPVNIIVTLTEDGATGGGHYHGGGSSANSSANGANTGDAGIALYAALSLSSLTGMALVHKKRK